MILSYKLSMPNVGSWNGRWTGESNQYYVVRKYDNKKALSILNNKESNSWYYNFGDGWGAGVRAEIVDSKEAAKRRKVSKGFAGYEWMIDEIETHGEILTREKRKELRDSVVSV
jgi:hypothetical protein